MSATSGRWDLSFGMGIVDWPDKVVTFRGEKLRQDLEVFQRAGLKWIMTGGINLFDRAASPVPEMIKTAARWYEEYGMRMSSFHCAGPNYAMLDRSQEPIVANLLKTVELFAPLRMKAFVIHAGWIKFEPEDFARLPESMFPHGECDRILHMHAELVAKYGEDAVIDVAARNLKAMARAAQKHGIALAFEDMGDMLPLGDRATLEKLVQAIDEPNAGYCLDSGHAWMRGDDPADLVRWMGKRLFETHFHDCRGGSRKAPPKHAEDEHLPVGFGNIDWRRVIQALDEIGFPGPVTFEADGWPLTGDRPTAYRNAIEWWRMCESLALKN
jgi:sugar phosphate isomerase/epimerase